jgi:addiction module RelE/StbE family toxin
MEYLSVKWIVRGPRDLEKALRRLPFEVGRLYEAFVTDLENEGPFPKGWKVSHLHGNWKGFLRVVLKRDYRVVYRYESRIITIFIEKIADRKDAYEVS